MQRANQTAEAQTQKNLPPGAPISSQRRAEDTKRATGYEKTTTYNISNYCQFLSKFFIKKSPAVLPAGPHLSLTEYAGNDHPRKEI